MRNDPNSLRYNPYDDEDDSEDEIVNLNSTYRSPPTIVAPSVPATTPEDNLTNGRIAGDGREEGLEDDEDNESSSSFGGRRVPSLPSLIEPFRDTSFPKRRPFPLYSMNVRDRALPFRSNQTQNYHRELRCLTA